MAARCSQSHSLQQLERSCIRFLICEQTRELPCSGIFVAPTAGRIGSAGCWAWCCMGGFGGEADSWRAAAISAPQLWQQAANAPRQKRAKQWGKMFR